ncbi:stage II sporulation protein M [Saccharicrinis aurantiacus]|uniref:stage II sporulation protein M n=1 Tax=Saccharicrinis aurantiacus TaxID=1849719 RepID=UPI00094F5F55|nr:stage II sporulation protein M [Saccharicrinis aurantiacus]
MREIIFSKINKKRWLEAEQLLTKKQKVDPEVISKVYMQLSDDLSYARTYYPNSNTTAYLNKLVLNSHQFMHTAKRENWSRIYTFFKKDYPLLIHSHYKQLFYSCLIFVIAVLIGAFSAANDVDYVRLITGDNYVNMTIENIEKGEPLGVYASQNEISMFFMITLNNIRVALIAFAMGALLSVGTAFMLFKNGVMLGSFQYFFYNYNLLWESASGIWMHGTIEIFSIVVAGAAGLVMGNSILFPGTYSRIHSFQKGAIAGVKIVTGLVPFFIIAGFIESFLTRHSQIQWLSILVIAISLITIIFYFFIYPHLVYKKHVQHISA